MTELKHTKKTCTAQDLCLGGRSGLFCGNCNAGMGDTPQQRLEYLRGEIQAERISYAEISELHDLVDYIEKDDVELLQWASPDEEL